MSRYCASDRWNQYSIGYSSSTGFPQDNDHFKGTSRVSVYKFSKVRTGLRTRYEVHLFIDRLQWTSLTHNLHQNYLKLLQIQAKTGTACNYLFSISICANDHPSTTVVLHVFKTKIKVSS